MIIIKNKIALVTGSVRGLGKAISLELAKNGATVIIHYKSSEKLAIKTLEKVREFSKDSILVKADVTKENEVKKMFENIYKKFGKIDILINNVGNFVYKNISELTVNEWKDVIESNLYSVFYCSKYALPFMRKNKFGRIINIGCTGCDRIIIRENTTPYYIAKTGILMLTKAMAFNEAKYGITINAVSPGILKTSVVKPKIQIRYADFRDITNAILFLLSEKSDYINGANIEVSGGWTPGYD